MKEDREHGRKIPINKGHGHDGHAGTPPEGHAGVPGEEAAGAAEAGSDPAAEKAMLVEELVKAKAEARESQDKYLRLYAETENFKKRMNREYSEREKYCNEGLIKEFLPVVDNLERALGHVGETGAEGLVEGVRMVRKQFMDALLKYGVTQVESVGLPFDPAKQQAIMQVETDDYEEGTVVEEFQKGYFLNDRILRPAMVTVAKKPAAPGDDIIKEGQDPSI